MHTLVTAPPSYMHVHTYLASYYHTRVDLIGALDSKYLCIVVIGHTVCREVICHMIALQVNCMFGNMSPNVLNIDNGSYFVLFRDLTVLKPENFEFL